MNPPNIRLTDLLRQENMVCKLSAGTRDEAVSTLVALLHKTEGGFDPEKATAEVLRREAVAPTVITAGVAMPHARLEGLDRMLMAMGSTDAGIDFGAPEQGPVRIVFLILTPQSDPSGYLRAVAALSRLLGDEHVQRHLATCTSPREAHGVLAQGGDALPPYLSARHVMNADPVTVMEGDDLATVIEALCLHHLVDLPVIDEERDLRGIVSREDLLRLSLPEHLLWMEDLTTIQDFRPFSDLLRKDRETKVADFMREEMVTIHPEAPAIQLAKLFLRHGTRTIMVVEGRALLGVVTQRDFVAQVFWA